MLCARHNSYDCDCALVAGYAASYPVFADHGADRDPDRGERATPRRRTQLLAVINAQGKGTLIAIEDLPEDVDSDDLGPALRQLGYERTSIILNDLPVDMIRQIINAPVSRYAWDGKATDLAFALSSSDFPKE